MLRDPSLLPFYFVSHVINHVVSSYLKLFPCHLISSHIVISYVVLQTQTVPLLSDFAELYSVGRTLFPLPIALLVALLVALAVLRLALGCISTLS